MEELYVDLEKHVKKEKPNVHFERPKTLKRTSLKKRVKSVPIFPPPVLTQSLFSITLMTMDVSNLQLDDDPNFHICGNMGEEHYEHEIQIHRDQLEVN